MSAKLNASCAGLRILLCLFSAAALASCGDSGGDSGGAGGMAEGECSDVGSSDDIRIHVANSEDVASILVTIDTPYGSCFIDPLPTSTDMGLELGQAVYPLQPGDVVSFTAQSPGGGASSSCRVIEMSPTPGAVFADLFITSGVFLCNEGLEPAL